jgi:hypothetical protein
MHASDFQDVYPKLDDYIKSMQETWTLLTFYWGAAAFWPKCGSQDNGKACNNPLLHVHSSRSQCKFCKSVARWSCFRRNHDSICDRCLKAAQDGFLGPSGNKASTDVYDSLITSVAISSENRVIHCTQLRCRKPPHQTQINWKTSYRLQCAQMVAVIPVNSADSPLGRDCPLFWGEIVPHSQKESSIEHVKRGKGEISIRLLGKNDCDLFGDMMDEHQFSTGKRIVVVDMRVFVPEVISVLATLTSKLFKSGLKTVAFQSLLLDSTNASNMLALPTNLALKNILFFSIKNSTISAVKKLSDENKQILVEEIWSIPQVQSLDETQGRAFASALLQSLHTVQGPPGSGKVSPTKQIIFISCYSKLILYMILELCRCLSGFSFDKNQILCHSSRGKSWTNYSTVIQKSCSRRVLAGYTSFKTGVKQKWQLGAARKTRS